jgi:hypothetical protein
MNEFIGSILSLKGEQLDVIIQLSVIAAFIGIYITPLIILINDIWKRYDDKFLRNILSTIATLALPLFIIPYVLFRKETTQKEDNVIESELNILATTNNCIKCTFCNEINRAEFNYCIKCGSLLMSSCKNCNQTISLDWKHCAFCGINLIPEIKQIEVSNSNIEIKGIKTAENIIMKNKQLIYAVGQKFNSLITPSTQVHS